MEQPTQFGGFLLFQKCAANAFRSSYRAGVARGRAIDRIVRLEVFDGPALDASRMLEKLERSDGLQERVLDPHIARGVGLGEAGGTPYAAYDFELGVTLDSFVGVAREKAFPVPLDQALFIAERIALALAAAHEVEHDGEPVVHSFLTPDFVMLSNEGGVKVLGFETGPALREQFALDPLYASYLAPECRAGESAAPQDDVFSLAAILYELVFGIRYAESETAWEELEVQATGESISDGLKDLFEQSFAPRSERIANVLEWQQAIGRLILNGEYNPTTFNLAFLMHTILRDRLEQDGRELKREKQFLLSREIEAEIEAGTPAEESAAEVMEDSVPVAAPVPRQAEAATGPSADPVPDSEASSVAPIPAVELTGATSEPGRKPFWLGFALAAIAGTTVLGALTVVGSKQSKEPLAPEPLAVVVERETPTDAGTARSAAIGSKAGPVLDPEVPGDPDEVTRSEVVMGEVEEEPAIDEAELERRVEERARAIERNLEAEYQQKLEQLRAEAAEAARQSVRAQRDPETTDGEQAPERGAGATGSGTATEPTPADPTPLATEGPTLIADQSRSTPEAAVSRSKVSENAPPARAAGDPDAGITPASQPTVMPAAVRSPSNRSVDSPRADTESGPKTTPEAELEREAPPAPAPPAVEPVSTVPPRLIRLGAQTYPPVASRLGLSAKVRVKLRVGVNGRVIEAELLGAEVGSGFDAAALATARSSRWEPAMRSGVAVEAWTTVTIDFQPK